MSNAVSATPTSRRQKREVLSLSPELTSHATEWDLLVERASNPDVYYRAGYVRAYQEIGRGKVLGAIVSAAGVRALFPLLLRPLVDLPFAHNVRAWDALTPYGYGGFLLLDGVTQIDTQQAAELLTVLREWCVSQGIVSVYVRLHPLLEQENWFESSMEKGITKLSHGQTAAIETASFGSEDQMRAVLNGNRRRDFDRARKQLTVSWSSETKDVKGALEAFRSLYEQRMAALRAEQHYRFPTRYYDVLAEGLGSRVEVGLAWRGDELVGGALFFADETYWHFHLGASNETGRKYGASTFLMCEAAGRALAKGCQYLHLGGGLRNDDGLLAYKKSYGGPTFSYSAISLICIPTVYAELQALRDASSSGVPRAGYFPAYRASLDAAVAQ